MIEITVAQLDDYFDGEDLPDALEAVLDKAIDAIKSGEPARVITLRIIP